MLSTLSGNFLPSSSSCYVPQSQLQSTAPLAPWITSGANDVTSQEIYHCSSSCSFHVAPHSSAPCSRASDLRFYCRGREKGGNGWHWYQCYHCMFLPALQVEPWKEHILHTPDIITTNIVFTVNLCSYSSPYICREGTGQHRAHVAKKLSAQTLIHIWTQKSRWFHLHSKCVTVLGRTEHHSPTRSP